MVFTYVVLHAAGQHIPIYRQEAGMEAQNRHMNPLNQHLIQEELSIAGKAQYFKPKELFWESESTLDSLVVPYHKTHQYHVEDKKREYNSLCTSFDNSIVRIMRALEGRDALRGQGDANPLNKAREDIDGIEKLLEELCKEVRDAIENGLFSGDMQYPEGATERMKENTLVNYGKIAEEIKKKQEIARQYAEDLQ